MSWLALFKSALEGLGAFKFIWEEIKALNLKSRLDAIDERQQKMNTAITAVVMAETPEERKNALSELASARKR